MIGSEPANAALRVVRSPDERAWDDFVASAPDAQLAHAVGWRGIVENVLGREFIPLAALAGDGTWAGVLPLVRIRVPLLSHSLISMPYVNYGGPLGTPAARAALVEAAIAEARASGARTLELRSREQRVPGLPAGTAKLLVLLDLPDEAEDLWQRFPGKLRSQIRRPRKEGMEFRCGGEHLDAFYRVFARNMRDLGTPVYPRQFFEAIAATFEQAVFGAVYYRGEPAAAACGFVWRGEFEITWASALRDYNRMAPNMLLYWGVLEEMIRRGVRVFNFGRSTPGASTHRFKSQWGGRDVPLAWSTWSARQGADATVGPSALARAASAAWRRMPLGMANWLGPAVAKRLPWW